MRFPTLSLIAGMLCLALSPALAGGGAARPASPCFDKKGGEPLSSAGMPTTAGATGEDFMACSGSVTHVTCYGQSTGKIAITSTFTGTVTFSIVQTGTYVGAPLFTNYSVTQSGGSYTFINLPAGKYDVTITAGLSTCSVNNQTVRQPPGPTTLTHVVTPPACFGGSNGSIKLTASWPAPGTYESASLISVVNFGLTGQPAGAVLGSSIPPGVNMAMYTFNNLAAGTYTGTSKFNNTCTQSTTSGIPVAAPSAVTSTPNNPINTSCFNGSDGSVEIHAGGGIAPYSFHYRKVGTVPWLVASGANPTFRTATGLTAGTWELRVTDANGCSKVANQAISQPGNMAVQTQKLNDNTCNGGSNGSARWRVTSGGVPPYTFALTGYPSQTSIALNAWATFSGLPAGTYTPAITDANGCATVGVPSVTITQPAMMSLSIFAQSNVSCNGGSNGSVTISATGGNAPYLYDRGLGLQASPVFPGLSAGSYSITVTDNFGCTKAISTTITEPATALFVETGQFTVIECYGDENGAVDINVSGGTAPYTYQWSNGETTQDITELPGDTWYCVTVTDANGCQYFHCQWIEAPDYPLTPNLNGVNITCHGLHDGQADAFLAFGGTWPYTYSWDLNGDQVEDSDFPSINNLFAGIYEATITDDHGCQAIESVEILEPDPIDPNADFAAISCQNGEVTVYPTGGTGFYEVYTVNCGNHSISGSISPNFADVYTVTNLGTGTFCLKIVDDNLCESVVVSGPTTAGPNSLYAYVYSYYDVSCNGADNGAIYVFVPTGSGSYTFDDGHGSSQSLYAANDMVFYNLAPGNYSITVTDNNYGCTIVLPTITIDEPDELVSYLYQSSDCLPGGVNQVAIYVEGGTEYPFGYWYDNAPYYVEMYDNTSTYFNYTGWYYYLGYVYFYWDNSANVPPGEYTVNIYDYNGCSNTYQITLGPVFIDVAVTDAACVGSATGEIDLTVTGGAGPNSYYYYWDDEAPYAGSEDRTGLLAGVYTVTATDYYGCSHSVTVQINQPSAIVPTYTTVQPTCNGGSDGSISANATGGTPGYEYRINGGPWLPGNTGYTFSGLAAGNYLIEVRDDADCIQSLNATLGQPGAITGATSTNPSNCGAANGSLTVVTTTGGTGPYQYSKNNGGTYQGSNLFTGLAAGVYTILILDANGCTGTTTGTVVSNGALNFTTSPTNISCFGASTGSIIVTATGGTTPYQYRINGGAYQSGSAFTGLAAGTYLIEVKDAGNCTNMGNVTLSQPASALTASASATNVLCHGASTGSVSLTVSGGTPGYTYLWSPGGATTQNLTNVAAGTYTCVVTDANGCTKSASATVAQPAAALNASASATHVQCFGGNNGAIALAVTGGTTAYSYLWSPGGETTQNLSGLTAGTYSVVVTDANGCTKSASATVNQPASMISTSMSSTAVSCFGGNNGTATVAASGGTGTLTYLWAPGGGTTATISGLAAGTYSVTVFDANNCQKTASVTVSQPAAALAATATATNSACGSNNGTITVAASGGTPAYTYSLNGGPAQAGNSFTGLAPGSYTITVKDANNCTTTASATVGSSSALNVSTSQVNVLCNGQSTGSITVTATGGTAPYQFRANGGPYQPGGTFSGLAAGSYFIEIIDNGGCSASTTLTITQPSALTVAASTTNATCNGAADGTVAALASGGVGPYQYKLGSGVYQNGSNFTGLAGGTYVLSAKDANGCTAAISVTIINPSLVTMTTTVVNVTCNGGNNGSITVNATGGTMPYQYKLGAGAFQAGNVFSGLAAGTYAITVKDANGCLANANATVGQPAAGPFNVTLDQILPVTCAGGTNGGILVTVSGCGPFTFVWTNSGGSTVGTSEDLVNVPAGTYNLKVTDAGGSMLTLNGTIVGTNAQTISNFAIANNTTCYVTLSWTATPNVTGYAIQYKPCASSVWTTVNVGNVTTFDVTGLTASTCYDFAVRFLASPCNGAWTYLTSQTTATWNPPVNAKSLVNSNSSATISWQQSGCPGPTPANVELRYRKVGATSWTVITLAGTALSHTLNGLMPNTCYEYRLRNRYVSGGTQWSNMTPSKTFCLPLSLTGGGGEQANISVEDPSVISIVEGVSDTDIFDEKAGWPTAEPLAFTLSPNPAVETVQLKILNIDRAKPLAIRVLSATGRLVFELDVNRPEGIQHEDLDIRDLAPGLYFVEIQNGSERLVQKLVKA